MTGAVVGPGGGERPEQRLDRGRLAELQPAVGEEQDRAHVPRLLRVQRLELLRRARQVRGLVVREREVVADATVLRRHPKGAAVRLDRLLVAAERGEGRSEVRPGLDAGREREALAVRGHGTLEFAGLVEGERPGHRGASVLGRRSRGDRSHQERHRQECEGGRARREAADGHHRIRSPERVPPQKRASVSAVASRTALSRPRLYPAGA